jgi:hypothetical protein
VGLADFVQELGCWLACLRSQSPRELGKPQKNFLTKANAE